MTGDNTAYERPFPELWDIPPDITKAEFVRAVLKDTFRNIAEHFHETRRRPWPETREFATDLVKGSTVADLGCGNGRNSVYLAGRGAFVKGLDLSESLLELARESAEAEAVSGRCRFVQGDLTALPFKDREFDGGIYIASLHHLPAKEGRTRSLNEMNRVLKDGAPGLISVWRREQEKFRDLLDIWEEHPLLERGDVMIPWKSGSTEHPRYYHLFQEGEFSELLEDSDLMAEDVYLSGDNWYAKIRGRT